MLTEAQLLARRSGIGSSDIAPVCGLSSWSSPIDVWLSKTGQAAPPRDGDGLQLEVGHYLEPLCAELYTRQTGEALQDPQTVFRSARFPWQLATPDRLRITDGHSVECKIAYSADGWGEQGTDEVPQEYVCQKQWQLDVLGLDWGHFAAIVGRSFRIYTVRKDEDLCGALREAAERFWTDYVLKGVQPPVTAHERDRLYLQQRFADYESKMVEALPVHEELAGLLAEARARLERVNGEVELYSNQMRELIGDNEGIKGVDWKCTWKAPKTSTITNWEAVARELGADAEVIAKHSRPKQNSRRFLFTHKGQP